MGRWADQDSDEHRLPEGVQRVGYDADTQKYTFRDATGRYYESEEGNRYGVLHPSSSSSSPQGPSRFELEQQALGDKHVKRSNSEAVKMMLPFALLVFVVLILLFKFVSSGGEADPVKVDPTCSQGHGPVQIEEGQTCWGLAQRYRLGIDELLGLKGNEAVDCDSLKIGQAICVPT